MIQQLINGWKGKYAFSNLNLVSQNGNSIVVNAELNDKYYKLLLINKDNLDVLTFQAMSYAVGKAGIPLSFIPKCEVKSKGNIVQICGHPYSIDHLFEILFNSLRWDEC